MNTLALVRTTTYFFALTLLLPLQLSAGEREEIEMLQKSSISLIQAIELAEKETNGKALSAEIEDDRFSPVFEVKVVQNNQIYKVEIDGAKGTVVGQRVEYDD